MRRVFFFGDSIVVGRMLPGCQNWANLVSDFLMKNYPGETLMYNLGVTSEDSEGLKEHLDRDMMIRMKHRSPDDFTLTFIATGLNDSKAPEGKIQASENVFESNIRKVIKSARRYSDLVIIVGLIRVSEKIPLDFYNDKISYYNDILERICLDENVPFVDLYNGWPDKETNLYSGDGIHPNQRGHEFISKRVLSGLRKVRNIPIDRKALLRAELMLDENEFISLNLSHDGCLQPKSELFLGLSDERRFDPDLVLGGPCLRNDIYGICLNTFYQIFMPLKVAQMLKRPCRIYLGIKEEILLSPDKENEYKDLKKRITVGVCRIADELGVQVDIIDTSDTRTDQLIESTKEKERIILSKQESHLLYCLSGKGKIQKEHTKMRIRVNERVITCHGQEFLTRETTCKSFLIVEDLEQLRVFRKANKQTDGNMRSTESIRAIFSAFLPLPNIYANSTMFKGKQQEKVLLFRSKNEYEEMWMRMSPSSKAFYLEVIRLIGRHSPHLSSGAAAFTRGMKVVSEYFKQP